MKFRQISIIAGIVFFIGAIFLFRFLSSGPQEEQTATNGTNDGIGVVVQEIKNEAITSSITFTGNVIPENEIQLFAEVQGILHDGAREFEEGMAFKKGEIILKMDDREQQQLLKSQKSQFQSLITQILADIKIDYPNEYDAWFDYLNSMDINRPLAEVPSSENRQFTLFLSGRNVLTNYYSIKQSEVRLSKFTITAPFDGVVTQALIEPGTLVRPNQPLGQFTQTGSYEIEASINASDRFFISTGDNVALHLDRDQNTDYEADVARINARINPLTQTLLVYLTVKSNRLLPGQYVSGTIEGEIFENADKIATKALVRNDLVFVIENNVAVLERVEVLTTENDSTIVRGITDGKLVINEFRDASFEGRSVVPVRN
ncbi:MAG: HlyD family efflux transporter periplasmic adaptor subunit [bacterium]|nr:HlyD family efflux transporter periplasmic adaptor subunit [bacterium]